MITLALVLHLLAGPAAPRPVQTDSARGAPVADSADITGASPSAVARGTPVTLSGTFPLVPTNAYFVHLRPANTPETRGDSIRAVPGAGGAITFMVPTDIPLGTYTVTLTRGAPASGGVPARRRSTS